MRNRVGFSYIDKYDSENYDKYAYTIFLAYADDTTAYQANVWFNGIKYTYLKNNVNSFSYHDRGTSYISQKDNIVSAYEYEYDRYVNVITSDDNIINNKKQIVNSTKDNNGNILPVEQIISYVQVEENSYTYYPSFVEGFTSYDYTIQKIAYGYTTGNIPHGEYNFNSNSYGMFLGTNDTDLSYNICGTYDNGDTSYKIIGIGIDDTKIPHDGLSSKKDYTNIITAYVYILKRDRQDEISRVFNNNELYKHLRVYIPGLKSVDGCISGHASSYSYLSFTKDFNNVGSVLAIAELDYKNNKYKLRRKINFIAGSDRIVDIDKIYFGVNGFDTVRSSLLNGDNIEAIYVRTTPSNANNVLGLKFGYNDSYTYVNGIAKSYIGVDEKTDNSNRYFIYDLGAYNLNDAEKNSYYINAPVDAIYTYSYIYSNNGFETIKQHPIYHVTIEDTSLSYHVFFESESNPGLNVDNWTFITGDYSYDIIDTNRRTLNCTVDTSFSIFNKYPNSINRTNSYHIVDVNCEYSYEYVNANDGNIYTYTHIYNYTPEGSTNPIYRGIAYNTYSANYRIGNDPGRYILSYHLQNGVIENDGYILGPNSYINRLYIESESVGPIYTYEGAIGVSLVGDSNYVLYNHNDEYNVIKDDNGNYFLKVNSDNLCYSYLSILTYPNDNSTPIAYSIDSCVIGSINTNNENLEPGKYSFSINNGNVTLYDPTNNNRIKNFTDSILNIYKFGVKIKCSSFEKIIGFNNDEIKINEDGKDIGLDVSQMTPNGDYYEIVFKINHLNDIPNYAKNNFTVIVDEFSINDSDDFDLDNFKCETSDDTVEKTLTIKINKNKLIFNNETYIEFKFNLNIKLNNDSSNKYLSLQRYTKCNMCIYNSIENIEEDGLPDTLNLFTNVRDAKDNTSEGPTPYIYQYSQTENVEKFKIKYFNNSNNNWTWLGDQESNSTSGTIYDNLNNSILTISQKNGYITFEPKYNNDNKNIVKIKLIYTKQNTNSVEENEHTIHLIPFKFSFAVNKNTPDDNDNLNVHYLTKYKTSITENNKWVYTDTNDNDKKYDIYVLNDAVDQFYYEEILMYNNENNLGEPYNLLNDTYYKVNASNSNEMGFFIYKFCNKLCTDNSCMLDYFGIKQYNQTNNVLIPNIHFKLKFIYSVASNIPNGVIFTRSWHDTFIPIKQGNNNKNLYIALVYSHTESAFFHKILATPSNENASTSTLYYVEPSSINDLNIMRLEYSHIMPSNTTIISQNIKYESIEISNNKELYTNGKDGWES